MRALCGAIITCGALIGMGLTAIGIGERYSRDMPHDKDGNPFKLSSLLGQKVLLVAWASW